MSKTNTNNPNQLLALQNFVTELQKSHNLTYYVSGRKFTKVFVNQKATYFVAMTDMVTKDGKMIKEGEIFGAKSFLSPNYSWYYGNISNISSWDWSGPRGVPVTDYSVTALARTPKAKYTQYQKVSI